MTTFRTVARTVADAVRCLGVSRTRVIQLDSVLKPRRSECGTRLYDPARIDELVGWRAAIAARKER